MYEKNTIKLLFRLSRIPVAVYNQTWDLQESFPAVLEQPESFEQEKFDELKECLHQESVYFLPYDTHVPIALCGCKGEEEYFILGPFSYGKTDNFQGRNFIRSRGIRECPPCQLEDLCAILGFFMGKALSEEESMQLLDGKMFQTKDKENRNLIVNEELRQLDAFQKNHTYIEEQVLYDHIKAGDVEYLKNRELYHTPSHPVLIEDLKKNEEYMAVISISLAARVAIEGGLSSAEGFINNDIYLKKLSECKTIFEMNRLRRESQLYFARLVAAHKKESAVNFHVEEAKKNILTKRFGRISIQELAEASGISKEYLQKLFKKHEGISITEYIANVKTEAACNLLKYSDRQIQEIAEYLHYGSVSHFSGAFRKRMHQSPKEYREKNRQTDF